MKSNNEFKTLPKTKALEILNQEYDNTLKELEDLELKTPYREIESLVQDLFKDCVEFEIEYYFQFLYDYVDENEYIREDELYELITDTVDKLYNACYDNVITNIIDYLYENFDKKEAKRLEEQFNQYFDYIIEYNI